MSTLIFDRTQADADRAAYLIGKIQRRKMLTEAEQAEYNAGLRGCYNITDLNRVEVKVRELAETLRSYGYSVDYTVPMKGASVLPSGYTQLEYIQSSGTQYVDTGMKTTNETSIIIDAQVLAMNQEQYGGGLLFGSCNPVQNSGHEAYVWQYKFNAVYNSTANVDTQTLTVGDRLRVEFMKNVCTVIKNGQVFYTHTFSPSSFTSTVNLYLFVLPRSTQYFGKIKLYSCEIYEGSSLVRDFIPCKNPSGAVGLYDTVNDTFYGNSGTGTFAAGPEIGALEDREWQYTDTMLESDVLLYLANIAALRDVIQLPPDVPPLPTVVRWIDWMAANDIERIVYELDRMIYGIVPLFRRCGTFRAGKNAQHLLLAKGVN